MLGTSLGQAPQAQRQERTERQRLGRGDGCQALVGRGCSCINQLAVFWERGAAGHRPPGPRSPLPSLGLGRRAQQAAPGHRRSYKLLGRGYKRANPCSHRTGFVPAPEPSLTINRGWVSSKVCSICCLLLENRSPRLGCGRALGRRRCLSTLQWSC